VNEAAGDHAMVDSPIEMAPAIDSDGESCALSGLLSETPEITNP
jgi:hypothetical protein